MCVGGVACCILLNKLLYFSQLVVAASDALSAFALE